MNDVLLAIGFAAALAHSAPAQAEPAMAAPNTAWQVDDPSVFWFFGDGGFGCPLWWCGEPGWQPGARARLAPRRPPQADPSDAWFFGDGGFGCPEWQCGSHRQAPEGR